MSLNADIGCKRQRDEVESSAMAKRNKGDFTYMYICTPRAAHFSLKNVVLGVVQLFALYT